MEQKKLNIGELSSLSGLSRRAIHYYVQQKLLPPPLGGGRAFYYTTEHLDRLRLIGELQRKGLSLEEIRRRLDRAPGSSAVEPVPEEAHGQPPTLWVHLDVALGVNMQIQNGQYRLSAARLEQLRLKVREAVARILEPFDETQGAGS